MTHGLGAATAGAVRAGPVRAEAVRAEAVRTGNNAAVRGAVPGVPKGREATARPAGGPTRTRQGA